MEKFYSKFINIKNLVLFAKILLLIFITYLNLSKGESGALIHFIGTVFSNGNMLIGLAIFSIIFLMFLVISAAILFFCKKICQKFIIISVISDIIFVLINLFAGIYLSVNLGMPFEDAFSKYTILTCGSGFIFILSSLVILILSVI